MAGLVASVVLSFVVATNANHDSYTITSHLVGDCSDAASKVMHYGHNVDFSDGACKMLGLFPVGNVPAGYASGDMSQFTITCNSEGGVDFTMWKNHSLKCTGESIVTKITKANYESMKAGACALVGSGNEYYRVHRSTYRNITFPSCSSPTPSAVPSPLPSTGAPKLDTCLDVKKEYKRQGCCGMPTKMFNMMGNKGMQSGGRRVSQATLLEDIKLMLEDAKLQGGDSHASHIAADLIDFLNKATGEV